MATRLDQVRVEPYPDDFVPKMQQLLAILGDLDQRYEADRYHLENWSGPQAIKAQLLADLEQSHRANQERSSAALFRTTSGLYEGDVQKIQKAFHPCCHLYSEVEG